MSKKPNSQPTKGPSKGAADQPSPMAALFSANPGEQTAPLPCMPINHEFASTQFGADEALVHDYLSMPEAAEVSHMAAMMATRKRRFDPKSLIENAATLLASAKRFVVERRMSLLGAMSEESVSQLARLLSAEAGSGQGIHLTGMLQNQARDLAVRRAAELVRAQNHQPDHEGIFDLGAYSNVLAAFRMVEGGDPGVDGAGPGQLSVPRPDFPCSLPTALRWVTQIQGRSADEFLTNIVFRDYLLVHPMLTRDEARVKSELERTIGALVDRYEKPVLGDHPDADDAALREQLPQLKTILAECAGARKFRENFSLTDRSTPNRRVQEEAKESITRYWQDAHPVRGDDRLAWLALNVLPFWNKHRDEYLDQMKTKDREAQEAQEKMSAGTDKRDRPLWIKRTKEFAAVLTKNECPVGTVTSTAMEQFKEILPNRPDCSASVQSAVDKVATFMNALCGFTTKEYGSDLASIILRTLSELGGPRTDEERKIVENASGESRKKANTRFKASAYRGVSETTAIMCLNILREASNLKPHPVPSEDHSSADPPAAAKKAPAKPRVAKGKAKVTVKESRANKKREVKPHWDELS